MESLGTQILVELYNCNADKINDVEFIESAMLSATQNSGATIISHNFHKFNPHGVSGVVVIAESHVSIHSWPEYDYAAVDIFICGESIDPRSIQADLKEAFESKNISSKEMKRGMFSTKQGQKLPFKTETQGINK